MSGASREADGYEVEPSSADQHMTGEQGAEKDAPTREELVKGVRMAIVSWNTLGPRKVGEDASEFIADWLLVNRVAPPASMSAVTPEQRATLLRVLDRGVESRNMTHETALTVLDIIDSRAARVSAAATKARAEALREAADELEMHAVGSMCRSCGADNFAPVSYAVDFLRDRADTLAPDWR